MWNDFLVRAKHPPPYRRLPFVVWSRLFLDLEPYLTERYNAGAICWRFIIVKFRSAIPQSC